MLLLAHTGITLGAAAVLNKLFSPQSRIKVLSRQSIVFSQSPRLNSIDQRLSTNDYQTDNYRLNWLAALGRRIDIRVLLVGALLPDIIDKPLGMVFLGNVFENGRIFCHTLLFLVIITLAGVYLYRSRSQLWPLILSFGIFMHLVLDQMWLNPRTFLWPLYGFSFPREEVEFIGWLKGLFSALCTEPSVYVLELIGGAILVWFALIVIRQKRIHAFIRNGSL